MSSARLLSGVRVAALLVTCVPWVAPGQVVPDSLPGGVSMEMIVAGERIFHTYGMCVTCHGRDAHGLIGPDLTDSEWLQAKGSYLSILGVILSGVSEQRSSSGNVMPPRGGEDLTDKEVRAAAAYVWAQSHPQRAANLPAGVSDSMIRAGRDVFHGKGSCSDCHGEDATGIDGPNLTDASWLQAKGRYEDIVLTILRGIPAERSTRGIEMPPRGGSYMTEEDVRAVAAYVWFVSHTDVD